MDELVTIDSRLREVFSEIEGVLGVRFSEAEVARVFHDAENDQRNAKEYVFYKSANIRVTGSVDEYEPEEISVVVKATPRLESECKRVVDNSRFIPPATEY
jgi:hypothetical protein